MAEEETELRRELILRSQSARLRDRGHYFEILAKHQVPDGHLYRISIELLQSLVDELETRKIKSLA